MPFKFYNPLWVAWRNAKRRCYNPADDSYSRYGARDITMCDEWLNDWKAFAAYMGPRPDGHTVDRIDVNGDYKPGNMRWATPAEQARNKTNNRYVLFQGVNMMLQDCADMIGVQAGTLSKRLRRYPPEVACVSGNLKRGPRGPYGPRKKKAVACSAH